MSVCQHRVKSVYFCMIKSGLLWPSGTLFRLKPAEIREKIAAAMQEPLHLPVLKKVWKQGKEHSVLLHTQQAPGNGTMEQAAWIRPGWPVSEASSLLFGL